MPVDRVVTPCRHSHRVWWRTLTSPVRARRTAGLWHSATARDAREPELGLAALDGALQVGLEHDVGLGKGGKWRRARHCRAPC